MRWFTLQVKRPILAFFRMPGATTFGILLFLFAIIIITAAVLDLWLNHINPEDGATLDEWAAIYAVFVLLVFETPLPLPEAWLTRLVFFAVPIARILVLGQGLLRLGQGLMNRDLWDMLHPHDDEVLEAGDRFGASASDPALYTLSELPHPLASIPAAWKVAGI